MNTEDLGSMFMWGFGIGIAILIVGASVFVWGGSVGENIKDKQFDDCITLSQKAVPDPNDTESRANFIRTCYED